MFYYISEKVLTVSGIQFPLTLEEIKSKEFLEEQRLRAERETWAMLFKISVFNARK